MIFTINNCLFICDDFNDFNTYLKPCARHAKVDLGMPFIRGASSAILILLTNRNFDLRVRIPPTTNSWAESNTLKIT